MRILLLSFSLLIFTYCTKSQSPDCSKIHVGKFELNTEASGITSIVRTGKQQIETNKKYNITEQYDVAWIDDCTYQLKNRKVISGKPTYDIKPTDIITVKVMKIENDIMFFQCSYSFSDYVFEGEMRILD